MPKIQRTKKEKTVSSKESKKTKVPSKVETPPKEPKVETPPKEPEAPVEPEVTNDASDSSEPDLVRITSEVALSLSNKIKETCREWVSELRTIRSEVIQLEKREKKRLDAKRIKDARAKARGQSGLQIPVEVSNELSKFLGLEKDEKISRVEAVRRIYSYIRENNLKDPEQRRVILPDKKLKSILNTKLTKLDKDGNEYNVYDRDGLHIFTMQALISHNFISKADQAAK